MSSLSSILGDTPRFSFFDELIAIPTPPVSQHDLFKINKIIDDIIGYLLQVLRQFESSKQLHNRPNHRASVLFSYSGTAAAPSPSTLISDIEWYYEGKDGLHEVVKNIDSIDTILGQLLQALDESPDSRPGAGLLDKFEQTSDLLLDVKKYSIISKKRLDIAINYKDIEGVIESLIQEVESCERLIVRMLSELQLTNNTVSSAAALAQLGLEGVVGKISGHSGRTALQLPTFNSNEEESYAAWLDLQAKVQPLRVSLEFLPMRLGEFEMICSKNKFQFTGVKQHLDGKYAELQRKWKQANTQLEQIKYNTITSKWNEVFIYLIHEVARTCNKLFLQVKKSPKTQHTSEPAFASSYKLCSTTIKIINKAFVEQVAVDTSLIISFNEDLLPKWHMLNDELSAATQSPSQSQFQSQQQQTHNNRRSIDGIGLSLRPYRISKKSPSPENGATENGYGIDLGFGVQNVELPFSIQQKDKVRDFFKVPKSAPLPLQKLNLRSLNSDEEDERDSNDDDEDDDDDDDTSTLVTSKRFLSIEEKEVSQGLIRMKMEEEQAKREKWDYLRNHKSDVKTRIPIIVLDYTERGLRPILKKKAKKSKIPVISPNHPVFHSSGVIGYSVSIYGTGVASGRAALPTLEQKLQLKPPVVLIRAKGANGTRSSASKRRNHSPTPSRGIEDGKGEIPHGDEDEGSYSFRKPSRKPSLIGAAKGLRSAKSMSSIPRTPPLPYQPSQSPTWRSTSPQRPPSSIGSRYDEEHLVQPLKSPQRWR